MKVQTPNESHEVTIFKSHRSQIHEPVHLCLGCCTAINVGPLVPGNIEVKVHAVLRSPSFRDPLEEQSRSLPIRINDGIVLLPTHRLNALLQHKGVPGVIAGRG
jgi:hypothetical protein